MYLAYSADPRMRINVGIRRRLAPLLDNNRHRIELLNSLLFSFPGTPIMYYGDEIGMGDNIYLGDRNGVRTPMQWTSDRNAGFSRAVPAKLYAPVIMDPIWGYQAVNVEAQLSDQSSLLHWTRNMIALRKLFQVFGRGTLEFLNPENRKVLAYIRRYDREDGSAPEIVLCVANLSRFAQPVSLDLTQFNGMVPVEMLGYVPFPSITAQPYPLTLSPYSFLWLELQAAAEAPEPVAIQDGERTLELLSPTLDGLLTGTGLELLQQILPTYLPHQRWFGAKSRTIKTVCVLDWVQLPNINAALVFLELTYENAADGEPKDIYQLPLTISTGEEVENIRTAAPGSIIATLTTPTGPAILHDAVAREDLRQSLLSLIEDNSEVSAHSGTLQSQRSSAFAEARGTGPLPARTGSAEQSNTSILYDSKLIMKLFRRLQPGENPDTEIGRFLTETAHFARIAPFLGDIRLTAENSEPITVAMLQGLIENEGDGWQWTLDELSRYYESVATSPAPHDPGKQPSFLDSLEKETETEAHKIAHEHAGLYLDAAALLGRRTAEMHLALATQTDNPAFIAEPFAPSDLEADATRIDAQIVRTLDALKRGMSQLTDDATVDSAALLLSRRIDLFARANVITASAPGDSGQRIRIHGDYHLGQVLRSRSDYVILDFEGEPARSLAERRAKQSPLKDVAGMLRSFSYAAYAGLNAFTQRRPPNNEADARNLEAWARLWQNTVSTEFLHAYRQSISANPHLIPQPPQAHILLNAYLLEKALYELLYELNNRPAWVRIPLAGILALPREVNMP
jgi:maltose alpha-D-glucosyltransferase/alpha-amylase